MEKKYKQIIRGENNTFRKLYRQYHPLVYKLQKKYYLKDFDQEDWLQEGRIVFYRSLEKYEATHHVSIGQFFKKNLENHIKSLLRKQYAVKRTVDTQAVSLDQKIENQGESFFNYLADEKADILDQMIIQEKLAQLSEVLSPFERTTFKEYINGKELDEIAKTTKNTERAVKSAYDRVKKKVRSIIYE